MVTRIGKLELRVPQDRGGLRRLGQGGEVAQIGREQHGADGLSGAAAQHSGLHPGGSAPAEACEAALCAVVAARAGMAHLDAVRQAQGLPPLPFGAALHLGEILWGNIGAVDRLDFTAIGPAVNLVSRLEGLCRPLGRSVLISGAVAAETAAPLVPLGDHALRGIAAPCAVFTLPDA